MSVLCGVIHILTAKEYLQQIKDVDDSINRDMEKLHELKSRALYKPMNYEPQIRTSRRVGTPYQSKEKLSDDVCDIVALEGKINQRIIGLEQTKKIVFNQLNALSNAYYFLILYKTYLEYKTIKQIESDMNLSSSTIRKYKKAALRAFENKYYDELNRMI